MEERGSYGSLPSKHIVTLSVKIFFAFGRLIGCDASRHPNVFVWEK